jgi:hypothetical protein
MPLRPYDQVLGRQVDLGVEEALGQLLGESITEGVPPVGQAFSAGAHTTYVGYTTIPPIYMTTSPATSAAHCAPPPPQTHMLDVNCNVCGKAGQVSSAWYEFAQMQGRKWNCGHEECRNPAKCDYCRQPYRKSDLLALDYSKVCAQCAEAHYAKCMKCGCYTGKSFRMWDLSGYLCGSCLGAANVAACRCQKYVPSEIIQEERCPRCFSLDGNHVMEYEVSSVCESTIPTFVVDTPHGRIESDVPFTIDIPGGEIRGEGVNSICSYLSDVYLSSYNDEGCFDIPSPATSERSVVEDIEWVSTTSRGSLTKRIAKWYRDNHKFKLPTNVMSRIGDLAANHATQPEFLRVLLTRDINKHPAYYCNDGSCWWGIAAHKEESRCLVKSYGGIALLLLGEHDRPQARAWLQPIVEHEPARYRYGERHLWQPTPDITGKWLLYNGYSAPAGRAKDSLALSRIWAQVTGLTYHRVSLRTSASNFYINYNDTGTQTYVLGEGLENVKEISWSWKRDCDCDV